MATINRYAIKGGAAGLQDGTSWANAYDSLDDIYDEDPGGAGDIVHCHLDTVSAAKDVISNALSWNTKAADGYTFEAYSNDVWIEITGGFGAAWILDDKDVLITGDYTMRWETTASGGRRLIDWESPGGSFTVEDNAGLLLRNNAGGAVGPCCNFGAGTIHLANVIVEESADEGFMFTFDAGSPTAILHHCGAFNCVTEGFEEDNGSITLRNCVAANNGGNNYEGPMSLTNCASDDGTGSAGLINLTMADEWTNVAGYDFTLVSGNSLEGAGTDLRTDADVPVAVDIVGVTRPASPAIGPYEPAAGSPAIQGDVPISITPGATMQYQQHPSLAGSASFSIVPGATMNYTAFVATPGIQGSVSLSIVPQATMVKASHYAFGAPEVSIGIFPQATMLYSPASPSIQGSVSLGFTPQANMFYTQADPPGIVGSIGLSIVPQATMSKTSHHAIQGYIPISFTVNGLGQDILITEYAGITVDDEYVILGTMLRSASLQLQNVGNLELLPATKVVLISALEQPIQWSYYKTALTPPEYRILEIGEEAYLSVDYWRNIGSLQIVDLT